MHFELLFHQLFLSPRFNTVFTALARKHCSYNKKKEKYLETLGTGVWVQTAAVHRGGEGARRASTGRDP